jgi:O-antigen ligase
MAWTARPHPSARAGTRTPPWDAAGLLIVGALAAWTVVASLGRDEARPLPVLALLAGAVALFVVGRAAAHRHDALVPELTAVAIGGAVVLTFPDLLRAGGAPTGYANTNATLAGLGAIAAAAALSASRGAARRDWAALALALVLAVLLSESIAAAGALALAAVLAVLSAVRRDAAVAPLGGLVATWLAFGVTTSLAAGADADSLRTQDELRTELWNRALVLLREAPLRGFGPGSFEQPPTLADPDLRWAHHELLQQGAELGVVGVVLALVLVAWLFAHLWHGRDRGLAPTVAGASAVTLVTLHASVDHVLHTPVVPLTLALLVGWATAPRPDPHRPGPERRPGRGSPGSHPPPR